MTFLKCFHFFWIDHLRCVASSITRDVYFSHNASNPGNDVTTTTTILYFIMCCWCLPKVKLLSSVTVPIQNCILSLDIIYDVCNWKQSQRSNLSCRLQRDQIWRNFTTLAKLWKSLGNFSKLNLVLEKRLKHLLGNCYAFGSIYIFINGPILKIISPTGHTGGKKSLHSSPLVHSPLKAALFNIL